MPTPKFLVLLMSLFLSASAPAQNQTAKDNEEDDPYEAKAYFMYGINYLSNNVYLGRKDSVASQYITPYLGYHFQNGIYAKGAISYSTAKGGRIDLTTLEAGYDHSFNDYFNGGVNLAKFFYNKNSLSVRGNSQGSCGVYGQFNNNIVEPQLTFDLNFNSNSKDYVVGLLLDHEFKLIDKTLHIIPTTGITTGTQNYYDEYFINRLNKKNKKGKVKSVVLNPNKLVPLVYELSTKCTYLRGKWLFTLTPIYAIPVSPATVTINGNTNKEKLSNTFYVELDVCHR